MLKNVFFLLVLAGVVFASCNQSGKDKAASLTDTITVTVATFDTSAHSYVDRYVWIEGTVLHTCKHGGKRMFLADGNDSITVEVTAGGEVVKFDETLIGSRVKVLGTLKELRIDTKYLNEWEAELMKPEENHETGVHTAAAGHEDQSAQDKLGTVNAYRTQLAESGQDHLSFYSIEAISFSELK